MKYMGSKNRIANDLLNVMLCDREENQYFVDLFCGGCNLIDKVSNPRIANDINKYLISLFIESQKKDFEIPFISKNDYELVKKSKEKFPDWIVGYAGFQLSYCGKFFGGYAGISKTKIGTERNYQEEAKNNFLKQKDKLKGIEFKNDSYNKVYIPKNSIIYCDIPYKNTTSYNNSKSFDYDKFYDWCIEKCNQGHTVFISEYDMPQDRFECVWSKELKSSLSSNGKSGKNKNSIEKLFIVKCDICK